MTLGTYKCREKAHKKKTFIRQDACSTHSYYTQVNLHTHILVYIYNRSYINAQTRGFFLSFFISTCPHTRAPSRKMGAWELAMYPQRKQVSNKQKRPRCYPRLLLQPMNKTIFFWGRCGRDLAIVIDIWQVCIWLMPCTHEFYSR